MSADNRFGPILTGGMFEAAIVRHLVAEAPDPGGNWMSTALGEIERVEGLDPLSIMRPLAIVTASEFEKMTEVPLPCVLVITPGLARPPERKGDGTLTMTWQVGIAGLIGDTDEESSRRVGQIYAAAISLAMTRRPSLGFGARTVLVDERYDDIAFEDGRTLGAGRTAFEVTVPNARTLQGGPLAPLPDPSVDPGPWPAVTSTTVVTTPIPITEEVA